MYNYWEDRTDAEMCETLW